MGDGNKQKIKNFKIYEKDFRRIKELACVEYGMTQWEIFEFLFAFCLENNDKLKKWYEKKTKQKK